MTTSWTSVEGALLAASLDPRKVADKLTELGVVAELDWYENTKHLMGLTFLTDGNNKLATISKTQTNFQTGPLIEKVVEELATTFQAEVRLGDSWFDGVPEGTKFPTVEDNDHGEVRVVEITRVPAASVPFIATAEEIDLASIEISEDARAIIYAGTEAEITSGVILTQAPAISLYASNDDLRLAALDEDYAGHSETIIMHSWNMTSRIVLGGWGPDEGPAGLLAVARNKFGEDQTSSRLENILPTANRADMHAALTTEGPKGFTKMVKALGLPPEITDFLNGNLEASDIPNARYYPAKGWTKAISSSVDLMLEKPPVENKVLNAYRTATIEKPWIVRTWASIEGAIGGTLLGLSIRTPKKNGWTKLATVVGAIMLVDAVTELGFATYLKQRWNNLTGGNAPK